MQWISDCKTCFVVQYLIISLLSSDRDRWSVKYIIRGFTVSVLMESPCQYNYLQNVYCLTRRFRASQRCDRSGGFSTRRELPAELLTPSTEMPKKYTQYRLPSVPAAGLTNSQSFLITNRLLTGSSFSSDREAQNWRINPAMLSVRAGPRDKSGIAWRALRDLLSKYIDGQQIKYPS